MSTSPIYAAEPRTLLAPAHPRVAFDARFSIGQYRGMGRYLRRLIRPIASQAVAFAATGESDTDLHPIARGVRSYPAWEQLSLPRRIREAGVDFFLAPYNTAPLRLPPDVKLVLVIHDFIYLRSSREVPLSRSLYQNFGRLYRRLVVPSAIHRAHRIICVSQHTANELLQRFAIAPEKLSVIPNTIDESWFALAPRPPAQPYILCVSGEAPNKNLAGALQGFAQYCRGAGDRTTRMKIVGVKSTFHAHFRSIANAHSIAAQLDFLPYVSDLELQALYSGAAAFFFPSCDEGFGIPLLEAMAAGVPVVASNASSIPEVAADAALYFHPNAPSQMAEQITNVLSNPALQRTMSSRGRARAQRFHPFVIDAAVADFWRQLFAHE